MKQTKDNRFGYGEIKYQSEKEFPFEIDYNGCHWYCPQSFALRIGTFSADYD